MHMRSLCAGGIARGTGLRSSKDYMRRGKLGVPCVVGSGRTTVSRSRLRYVQIPALFRVVIGPRRFRDPERMPLQVHIQPVLPAVPLPWLGTECTLCAVVCIPQLAPAKVVSAVFKKGRIRSSADSTRHSPRHRII